MTLYWAVIRTLRTIPLRTHLVALALAVLLPLFLFSVVMVLLFDRLGVDAVQRGLQATVRATALSIDRQFARSIDSLEALGASEALGAGDLRAFHASAVREFQENKDWRTLWLADAAGRQLVNVAKPFGAPLPSVAADESFQRAAASQRVTISGLAGDLGAPGFAVPLALPVRRDGELRYVLVAELTPDSLSTRLTQHKLPEGAVGTLVDQDMKIVGRTRAISEFRGQRVPAGFATRFAAGDEGTFGERTVDGIPVYGAFAKAPISKFTVAIGVPASTVHAPWRRSLWMVLAGGTALLLVGLGIAAYIGRSLSRSIVSLGEVAASLGGDGAALAVQPSRIAEIRAVGESLQSASRLLSERAREREQAAEALRRSNETLNAFIAASPTAIIVLDLKSRVTVWNPAAARLFGWSEAEVLGQALPTVPDEEMDARAHLDFQWKAGEAVTDAQVRRRRKDGSVVVVSLSVAPLRDAAGRVYGSIGSLVDITERVRLEDQLRQAHKMEAVGRLAGGIAHDFNNLLTVLSGRSELLLDRLGPDDPLRRDVELIHRTSGRAAGLTRQLLAFGRKQMLQPEVLDLNAMVSATERMLRGLIGENIEMVTVLAPDIGCVKVDPGQMDQILVNLVLNARDAMPAGGRLTIETANTDLDASAIRMHIEARPGPYVMLAVSDTGLGMDDDTRAQVFEPFFTTKEPGKGTGLGLATVYGIVKQSGGDIWVYSERGRGTTFKVFLPRVEDAATRTSTDGVAAPRGGEETVLLVEDAEGVRDFAREILEGHGYRVLEAGDPVEALALAERHAGRIDLLATDVVMPKMSGRSLAERLMKRRPDVRVLYLSGYTEDAIVHHGVLDPGIPFLPKPFTPAALARKVREVLDLS
jgi:PAS domain S-box-containing protein